MKLPILEDLPHQNTGVPCYWLFIISVDINPNNSDYHYPSVSFLALWQFLHHVHAIQELPLEIFI